jgi:integrase/recombinase XerD
MDVDRPLESTIFIPAYRARLGHESPAITHMYVEADLALKERALSAVQAPDLKQARYLPADRVVHFLEAL